MEAIGINSLLAMNRLNNSCRPVHRHMEHYHEQPFVLDIYIPCTLKKFTGKGVFCSFGLLFLFFAAVICKAATDIAKASLSSTGTSFGSTANYTCENGYHISQGVRENVRTCGYDGWSGQSPTCRCKYLMTISEVKERIQYKVNRKLHDFVQPRRVCEDSSKSLWTAFKIALSLTSHFCVRRPFLASDFVSSLLDCLCSLLWLSSTWSGQRHVQSNSLFLGFHLLQITSI